MTAVQTNQKLVQACQSALEVGLQLEPSGDGYILRSRASGDILDGCYGFNEEGEVDTSAGLLPWSLDHVVRYCEEYKQGRDAGEFRCA